MGDDEREVLAVTMRNVIQSKFWTESQTEESVEQLVNAVHGLPSGSVLILNAKGQMASFQGRNAEIHRTPNVWRMEQLPNGFDKSRYLYLDLQNHSNLTKAGILRLMLTAVDGYCVDVEVSFRSGNRDAASRHRVQLGPSAVVFGFATDDTLREFAPVLTRLPNRTKVVLTDAKVTDSGLKELGTVKHLTELELDRTAVTANGLRELAPLSKLERLRWISAYDERPRVTDEVLLALSEINLLHVLEKVVYNTDAPQRMADGGLSWHSLNRHPRRLEDANCLDLNITKVTDKAMTVLPALPHLIWLQLIGTGVTDAGLKDIGAVSKLVWLELGSTQVTDAGLNELSRLSNLLYLNLHATKVTDEGVKKLKVALPNCQITR